MPLIAPNNYQLIYLLRTLYDRQAIDVMRRLSLDDLEAPDLSHWVDITVETVRGTMTQLFQAGIVASMRRINALRAGRDPMDDELRRIVVPTLDIFQPTKGVMPYGRRRRDVRCSQLLVLPIQEHRGDRSNIKLLSDSQVTRSGRQGPGRPQGSLNGPLRAAAGRTFDSGTNRWPPPLPSSGNVGNGWSPFFRKALGLSFDLFNPKVLDAIDAATFQFCRETNETATTDLKNALRKLRKLLKVGLERGEATRLLARNVRDIFADPMRAHRIAATEAPRMLHLGGLLNAKESGVAEKKEWLTSSDACEACQKMDGRQVDLDDPFVIQGRGPYSRVLVPPLHPNCRCEWTEVL